MNNRPLLNQYRNRMGSLFAALSAFVQAQSRFTGGQNAPTTYLRRFSAVAILLVATLAGTHVVAQQQGTVNLSLDKSISNATPAIGNVVTYTVAVTNTGSATATSVVVSESMALGYSTYLSSTASVGTFTFNAGTGTGDWTVGSINPGQTVTLLISAQVDAEGVAFNSAEVKSMDGTDTNSIPGNGSLLEDDFDNACFSVPLTWYLGDEYTVDKPAGFSAVTWVADGQPVSASTTNASVDGDGNLIIKGPGTFSFQATLNGCPTGNCCNIIVTPGATASLGDYVFEDKNVDGIQNAGDTPIPGVIVTLFRNGTAVSTTTTDANGLYSFTGLTPGTSNSYVVEFTKPTGFSTTTPLATTNTATDSDADLATGRSVAVTLTAGESNTTIDAGYFKPASLGDYVFEDVNKNGTQDAGDAPISGVVVTLYKNGTPVATTTTDAAGAYSFTGLTPGTSNSYSVGFAKPSNFESTSANSGSDVLDSDADPITGLTGNYTLTSGESNTSVDAGFIRQTAGLGDFVFEDKNANGVQDVGDPGIPNVLVTLYQNGSAIGTTTTDANGLYSFTGLTPGTSYTVGFADVAGYTRTTTDTGDDTKDSDAGTNGLTGPYSLSANEFNPTVDAGYIRPASLGDYVFEDKDRDGTQSAGDTPIPGVIVTLFRNGSAVATTTTDATGLYSFTGLTPGAANSYFVEFAKPSNFDATSANVGFDGLDSDADPITGRTTALTLSSGESNTSVDAGFTRQTAGLGDYVFEDKNANGIQDAGDTPISDVIVTLFRNGSAISTTTTDASGFYSFTGLTPSVPYQVQFADVSGYSRTTADVPGSDANDSDAGTNGLTGFYSLTANEFNPTVDAGYIRPASIGDFVFEDVNKDGLQTPGEPGIPGVIVTLVQNGSAVATTTTDANGLYSFTGLTPGSSNSYVVEFAKPANYTTTTPRSGTNTALDSDADLVTGRSLAVTLTSGESNTTIDAGYSRLTAGLGDYVFEDKNNNGVQDAGDTPIANVLVTLYQSGSVAGTTTTDANGLYSFTGLTPGVSYTVGFADVPGYTRTTANVPGDDAKDSDAGPNGLTGPYSLTANEFNPTIDAGYIRPAALGDFVFQDNDRNGIQSPGDTPIEGVVVTLFQNGSSVATTTTDAFGLYSFTGLTPGTSNSYVVEFTKPVGTTATTPLSGTDRTLDSDADLITGRSQAVTLASGETNNTIDAGYLSPLAGLGNYVFFDDNKDGIQNGNDIPIEGVVVTLFQNGSPAQTTTTDGNGFYAFTDLTPGTSNSYSVGFTTPTGLTATLAQAGGDDTLDSDADPATGRTRSVTLTAGEFNPNLDAGYQSRPGIPNGIVASLGNYVFEDKNRDGVQDAGDAPIPGVIVTLFRNGSAINTATTDASGLYSFTGLTPGAANVYSVRFGKPTGFDATSANVGGDDELDSDADPATGRTGNYTLTAGENNTSVDAGFVQQTAGLGDYVFEDKNANGTQDAGDTPISGVLVTLYQSGSAIRTTTTDATGFYSFTGLTPSVSYTVGFANVPGFIRTTTDVPGDDTKDSDAGPNGLTGPYSLSANEFNPTVDAGYIRPASIGDFVFEDVNKDGLQTPGEPGIPGVVVTLVQNGSAVQTTTTDANGLYSFTGLTPGSSNSYVVEFAKPANYTTTTPRSGTNTALDSDADLVTGRSLAVTLTSGESNTTIDAGFSRLTAGLGDYVFEDVNRNGIQDAGDVPIPGMVVRLYENNTSGPAIRATTTDANGLYSFTGLTPGVQYYVGFNQMLGYIFTSINVGNDDAIDSDADQMNGFTGPYSLSANEFNATVDAGFYKPASIGDFVFNDQNRDGLQTPGEPGIPGVIVTLFRNGSAVETTTTDANGAYSFTGLTPGTSNSYVVEFARPASYSSTSANVGFDGLDSDADPITGRTAALTLSSGESNTSVDAGYYLPTAGLGNYVFEDKNRNGLQDVGDVPIAGVIVTLYQNGSAVKTATTDAAGAYSFTGLASGAGNVYEVAFGTPTGFLTTIHNANSNGNDDIDSDVNPMTGRSGTYTLTAGEFNPTVDAGYIRPASIGDYVFQDNDNSNSQTPGDTPIPGVIVTLFRNGTAIMTTTTDANGAYSFTGLTPGTSNSYEVQFTAPAGQTAVTPGIGGSTLDSDADPITGRTTALTLSSGESNTSVDAGYRAPQVQLASLGNYVFADNNQNGVQDGGDVAIPGVIVTLYQNGSAIRTTTTDGSGLYSFTGLTPGNTNNYVVEFATPTGYVSTSANAGGDDTIDSDVIPATGRTQSVTLAPGETNETLDAGYVRTASIGDYVFNDRDGSNSQTPGDTPIPGVLVTLYQNGSLVATTRTDGSGLYSFTGLTPGTGNSYSVVFTTPVGFTNVTPGIGGSTLDSDANPVTGGTTAFTLSPGESNTSVDAGYRGQTGSIGNYVWFDVNNDGQQGNAAVEPPVSGATVQLYAAGNLTTPIATTTTDANGLYLFSNLPSGQYVVRFTPPTGTVLATPNKLGVADDLDSDAGAGGLTGTITIDVTQPESSTARNNLTVDAGIVPFGSIGNYVWRDTNNDGIQNDGATGIPNVTVQLFDAADLDNSLADTTTDANGAYLFEKLISGNYVVKFTLPSGEVFTTREAGGDRALDSDAGTDGLSRTITINAALPLGNVGRDNMTIDAGVGARCATPINLIASASSTSYCVGGFTTVMASATNVTQVRWYLAAVGGTPSFTTTSGQSFTVDPTTTTTYYAEATTADGCVSTRVPVSIVVNARPQTPSCLREATVCLNETFNLTTVQLNNVPLPGSTLEWRTGISETSPLVSNPAAVTAGTYYLFERSRAGCYSYPAVLTVNAIDCRCTNVATVSTTLTSGSVCAGSPITLIASIGGSATGVTWATSNSATAGVITNGNSLTATYLPSAADLVAGQVEFMVMTNDPDGNGLCVPARSSVIVVLSPAPGKVYGASCDDNTICAGSTTKLIAFADNARIRWTIKGTNTVLGITDSGKSLAVTPTQTTTYVASAIGLTGCNSVSTAEVEVSVGPCLADLAIEKEVITEGPYRSGTVISYGIKAINNGPISATAVTVTDILPAGLAFVSATPSSAYNSATGTWTVGTLTAGSDRSLIIQARITGSGTLTNNARIRGGNDDPGRPQNNTATATITVDECSTTPPPTIACALTALCSPTESTVLTARDCAGTVRWSNGMTGNRITVTPGVTTTYSASCLIGNCLSNASNSILVTVTNVPAPTIVASATETCAGGVVTLTASGCEGGTIYWSDNRIGNVVSLTVNADTRISAQCRINNCYSPSTAQTIRVGGVIPKPTIVCSTTEACPGETVTLTAENCLGTPRWSTGQTTASIDVRPTTGNNSYSVICGDGACVSPRSDVYTIRILNVGIPTVAASTTSICVGGTVSLSATGCDGTINWSNGQTGNVISVTLAANESFYAYCEARDCVSDPSRSVAISVGRPTAPIIRANPNTAICAGESVTLSVSEGCENGTVRWSNTNLTGNSIVVTPGQNTTYTATCFVGSCQSAPSNEVRVLIRTTGSAPTIAASSMSVCAGGSVTLTAANCTGGTVIWSNQAQGNSITVTPQAGDVFYAICRQAAQCGSPRSNTISINLTTPPAPTVICSTSVICPGESVELTAVGCTGTPIWSTGAADNGKTTIVVSPTATTSYSVVCRNGSCQSAPSALYTINVTPVPAPVIVASSTAINAGESVTLTVTNECPGTITWSTNETGNSIVVTPTAAVSYYTATCAYRSCASDPSIRITVRYRGPENCAAKAGTLVAPAAEICAASLTAVTLTATPSGDAVVPTGYSTLYVLTKGSNLVIQQTSPTPSFTVAANNAGLYTIHTLVYNPATLSLSAVVPGTTTGTDVLNIIRNNNICADLDAAGAPTTIKYVNPPIILGDPILYRCLGEVVSWTATGCDNGTVTWSNGFIGNVISVTVVRDTWLSATCQIDGCTSGISTMVDVGLVTPQTPTIGSNKLSVCAGDEAILTASGCTNGTYLWSTGATTSSLTVTPQLSTTYAVKCVTASCESAWSPIVSLTVGAPGSPVISTTAGNGTVTTCFGQPITLTAQGCTNGAYTIWSNNMVGNSITVSPAASATYTAQCCTSDNCKSVRSNAIAVTVLTKVPQPRATNLTNTCPFLSVNLATAVGTAATTGGTFEFYTTEDLQPASKLANTNVTQSGTYYVVEKTTGGCVSLPTAIQVQINTCSDIVPCESNPVTVNAGVDDRICAAKTYKLKGSATGNGVTTQWSVKGAGTGTFDNAFSPTALFTPSLADVQAGQVTLVLTAKTNNTQCAAQVDEMVLTLAGPKTQPTVALAGATQLCNGQSTTLTASEAATYRWSTGATTRSIVVDATGSYTVQVLDSAGCSSVTSEAVAINVSGIIPAPLVANLRNACPATSVDLSRALSTTTAGSTYEYRLGDTADAAIVVNPAQAGNGTYFVFERTAGGCTSLPAPINVRIVDCARDTASADVAITKMVSNTAPKVGEALTYTLKVRNNGPGKAFNIDVRDVLPTGLNLVLGSGPMNFSVTNGAILKRIDSLAAGASDSIVFMARLTKKGEVLNIASITYGDVKDPDAANNTSGVMVKDTSSFKPGMIGLAKSIVGNPELLNDSTVAVSYRFTLTNFGDEDLANVGVEDDLGAVFSASNVQGVSLATTDADSKLALNGGYTGTGANTQLLGASSTLVAGQTSTFVMSVTAAISKSASHTFTNTAVATGISGTLVVSDSSVDGLDADPDKDGDPTNNAGGSTFFVDAPDSKTAQLGVAMAVDRVEKQADDSYNVTYKVYVKNFGSNPLTNVSLIDSVGVSFPAPASFSIVSAPTVNTGSELVVSSDFNGTSAPYYLNSFQSRLAAGKQDTLTYTINVKPNGGNGPFFSQVYATAKPEGSTETVTDRSNTGSVVVPKDNTKTALRFDLPSALLGVAKEVGTPVRVDANVWDVPYTIKICNLGTADLTRVQVIDDLSKTFGNGAQVVSVSVTADAGLKVNTGYTGLGLLTNMLDTTASTLPAKTVRYVQLLARVNVTNATSLTFANLAIGSALSGSVAVSDTSNTGSNVDPDNDLDPRNNNRGTRVVLNSLPGAPHIGIAMMVQDTARQNNGSYDVTYRIVVKNFGTVALTNVALSDSLSNVFNQQVGASYSVLGTAIASSGSKLKVNPGFNGGSDPLLVLGDSTSRLAVGATDTLTLKINVASNGTTGTFFNTVYAVAKAGTETLRDVSTNGMNPDPNGNNNPTDLTEREATPLFLPLSLETVFIPEGFSPNGDGINDLFVIKGTNGLTVSLEVFNRWGHRVYFSENYQNDWDGTSNTGVSVGNTGSGLPTGTYYYVVRLSDGREYVRYMTISR